MTLARATLAVGVAALTADSFDHDTPVATLVALATVALVLDYVDGWVARRTGTASALGARFDGEVDAFLILVLSACTSPRRPARGCSRSAPPATRSSSPAGCSGGCARPLPPRDWRKVVAATQGIALTVAAAGVLPPTLIASAASPSRSPCSPSRSAATCGGCGATGTHASEAPQTPTHGRVRLGLGRAHGARPSARVGRPRRIRTSRAVSRSARSCGSRSRASSSSRWPSSCPATARRILAWVVGPVLGLLVLVKLLDFGFFTAFDRPFNPVDDWSYTSIGIETLRALDRLDGAPTWPWSAWRCSVVAALVLPDPGGASPDPGRGPPPPAVAPGGGGARRGLGAVLGVRRAARVRRAHRLHERRRPGRLTRCARCRPASGNGARFAREIRHDRYTPRAGQPAADRPARQGRPAGVRRELRARSRSQGSSFSPQVDAVLDTGTKQLRAAGFSSRSGWLTSPTFGGISWLAHSTLQSGVWVDKPGRGTTSSSASDRFTLSQAFERAGWRAIDDVPSNNRYWPEGSSFYHYDKVYDRRNVGYHGPTYAYASMPDQYVYLALQRLELGKRRPPAALRRGRPGVEPRRRGRSVPPLIRWNRRRRRLDLQQAAGRHHRR